MRMTRTRVLTRADMTRNFAVTIHFLFDCVLNMYSFSPDSCDASFIGTDDITLDVKPFCYTAPSRLSTLRQTSWLPSARQVDVLNTIDAIVE